MVLPCVMVCDGMQCIQQASVVTPVCVCGVSFVLRVCDVRMYVFLLPAECLYTAPVEVERGCLPSPEELKRKILVKVHFHDCYIGLMYVRMYVHAYVRTFIRVSYFVFIMYIHTYVYVSSASLALHRWLTTVRLLCSVFTATLRPKH